MTLCGKNCCCICSPLVFDGFDGGFQGVNGLLEFDAFMLGDLEVEAADDAFAPDNGRPAERCVGEMVVGRDGEDAHFVVEDTIQDADDAGGDAVVGGAFFLDDVVGFVLDEIGDASAEIFC